MRFGIFIYDGVEPIDLATFGVLSMARRIRPDIEITTLAPRAGAVKLSNGLVVMADHALDTAPKLIRGDFMNSSLEVDTTLSAVDNAWLTGTGFSGVLRALEQSYGRDPATMIPDVRFTPNPNDAPGGPLVERADRQC